MQHSHCTACGLVLDDSTTREELSSCPSCGSQITHPDSSKPATDLVTPTEEDLGAGSEETVDYHHRRGTDPTVSYVALKANGGIDLGLPDPRDSRLTTFAPGMVLQDRYRLDSELGRGGFGLVFLGHDRRLDRPVAIKVMLPGRRMATPEQQAELAAMFAEEARLGANLLNPAIATVFDYGFHGSLPYTVFEYVPGETLRELLFRRTRLPLDEVLLFLGPVAQALDVAHARRVVHRDLKPENIRVTRQGQFKVLDLGLAREFDRHDDWRFAGTPAYASPEQAAELPSDGRSDQYTLALIVFELLTGRRPFVGRDPWDLLRQHRTAEPPDPRTLLPSIPDLVSEAILRALGKDPNQRFNTCQDFAAAVGCRFVVDVPESPEILYEARAKQPVESISTGAAIGQLESAVGRKLAVPLVLGIVLFLLIAFSRVYAPLTALVVGPEGEFLPILMPLGCAFLVAIVATAASGRIQHPRAASIVQKILATVLLVVGAIAVYALFVNPIIRVIGWDLDPSMHWLFIPIGFFSRINGLTLGIGFLLFAFLLLIIGSIRRTALRDSVTAHLLLASDAIWTNVGGNIRRWPIAAIRRLITKRGRGTLQIVYQTPSGEIVQEYRIWPSVDFVRFEKLLRPLVNSARSSPIADASVGEVRKKVVLLGRQSGYRYQVLGPISIEHNIRDICESRAQIRAAMMDADAVVDVRMETRYLLNKTLRRLTGVAVRTPDAESRFDLMAQWLSVRTASAGTSLLVVSLIGLAIAEAEKLRMPNAERLGAVSLLLLAFMAHAWPLALAVGLRWHRRPQLLTGGAVTAFGWGIAPLVGRLVGAFMLTVPEPTSRPLPKITYHPSDIFDPEKLSYMIFGYGPRMIPEDVRATLLAPGELAICIALMIAQLLVAGRIWRIRSEYREVQAIIPDEQDAPRVSVETVATVISAILIVALAAFPALVVILARR